VRTFSVRNSRGFTLIELMIAMGIGLLLLTGLSMLFVNTNQTNRELQKASQQIENGRFAIDTLSQDLRLAGFYGHLDDPTAITAPATVPPDPCEGTDTAKLLSALWYPVQGYAGTVDSATPASDVRPDVSSTTCGALTSANLKPGSDILVIRRADTNALGATDTTVANAFYIQASAKGAEIQLGSGGAIGNCPTAIEHCKADGTSVSTLKFNNGATPAPASPIRRLYTRIYFVAPCSVGTDTVSGVSGVCKATDDSIPTLKRLELSTSGVFQIVPLVEGIDLFKVEYGVDTLPGAANPATGYIGDSSVDSYVAAPADWRTVIGAKIYILARNTELTSGYTDTKTYTLGSTSVPARNDKFKRHAFVTSVRVVNPAGRREIP
jgi:type IV pilus assembly protein PilW